MFDATNSRPDSPRVCVHEWWIRGVIVGTDTSVVIEKVCAACGALAIASY